MSAGRSAVATRADQVDKEADEDPAGDTTAEESEHATPRGKGAAPAKTGKAKAKTEASARIGNKGFTGRGSALKEASGGRRPADGFRRQPRRPTRGARRSPRGGGGGAVGGGAVGGKDRPVGPRTETVTTRRRGRQRRPAGARRARPRPESRPAAGQPVPPAGGRRAPRKPGRMDPTKHLAPRKGRLVACFKQHRRSGAQVVFVLVSAKTGRIRAVFASGSSPASPLGKCLRSALKGVRLPQRSDAGTTYRVRYAVYVR
jgi:hypothetical protein